MKKVEMFPSSFQSPQQAMLHAEDELIDMEQVAIVYIRKGESHPRLTCSSMPPADLNFLGMALQHYSLGYLMDE